MAPPSLPVESSRRESYPHGYPEPEAVLRPFPTGVTWTDTSEMMRDIFQDLELPWVQKYMLRPDTNDDLAAMFNPVAFNRAMSLYFWCKTISELSDGFEATTFHVRLNLPMQVLDGVGVGVGVERSRVEDSGHVLFTKDNSVFRFVCNRCKHTQLNLRVQEDLGRMEATFQIHNPNGFWQYAMLEFNLPLFLSAFNNRTGGVDYEVINQALLQSIIGGVHHRTTPKIVTNELFPNKVADNIGEHQIQNVLCSYVNARPMMRLPVVADAMWAFNYEAAELRSMQNWGITDRLQRLNISPPKRINDPPITPTLTKSLIDRSRQTQNRLTTTANPNNNTTNTINNNNISPAAATSDSDESHGMVDCTAQATSSEHNGFSFETHDFFGGGSVIPTLGVATPSPTIERFTSIAPAPVHVRQLTPEEQKEQERREREEARKIRRREAAARSNAKRKAEKEQAEKEERERLRLINGYRA